MNQFEYKNFIKRVQVNYILKDGSKITVDGTIGQNVMEVAQENDIDIEGACAASLACCTCHVYVKQEYFDKLGEICDLEEDMLDQAPFLKENSRLSKFYIFFFLFNFKSLNLYQYSNR